MNLKFNIFKKKEKWWILKENDFDSRLANELKPVKGRIDERSHYFFLITIFLKTFLGNQFKLGLIVFEF